MATGGQKDTSVRIQNRDFWDISSECVLFSRFRFGNRAPVTKFVYSPEERVLVLGTGREVPTHKAMMSAVRSKEETDTSRWVRGILLLDRSTVYLRQGVIDPEWYASTTRMLRAHGLPESYEVRWGPEALEELEECLDGYP